MSNEERKKNITEERWSAEEAEVYSKIDVKIEKCSIQLQKKAFVTIRIFTFKRE